MAGAFRGFLKGLQTAPAVPAAKEKKGLPLLIGLAVIVLLAGAAAFFLLTRGSEPGPQVVTETEVQAPVVKAPVKIESEPTGAQVFIDNSLAGKTPLTIEVPLGKHEVRMSLPDYYEWEAQIQLDKPEEVPLAVSLEPMNGD